MRVISPLCPLLVAIPMITGCGASSASPSPDAAVTRCDFDSGMRPDGLQIFDRRDGGRTPAGSFRISSCRTESDDPTIMRCGRPPIALMNAYGFYLAFARPFDSYPTGSVLHAGRDFDMRFYIYLTAPEPTRMFNVEQVNEAPPFNGTLTITIGRVFEDPIAGTARTFRMAGHACGSNFVFTGVADFSSHRLML